MSKLYGVVTGDKGASTRASQREIETWIQTQHGRITVTMNDRGDYKVTMQPVYNLEAYGPDIVLSTGNVNTTESHPEPLYDGRMALEA